MAIKVTDPVSGVVYPSIKAYARAYGVPVWRVRGRLLAGYAADTAVYSGSLKNVCFTDHTGRKFASKKAMFAAWGIPYHMGCERLIIGWSVERTLTTPAPIPPQLRRRGWRKPKKQPRTGVEHVL